MQNPGYGVKAEQHRVGCGLSGFGAEPFDVRVIDRGNVGAIEGCRKARIDGCVESVEFFIDLAAEH